MILGDNMNLKRFNKHRKQKEIVIGSIITIIVIIGGISLYRSFAMYEEKASFDVLKGTVPDFSTKDITLAFTIDGQTQTNTNFPNKGEGYIVENVECEDNVIANWNNSTWSLENIKNNGEAKKVKCTVKFKTIKGEPILNGADPVLGEGMIPVKIGDKGVVKKVKPESGEWYSYEDKEWANAVILVDGTKEPEVGEEIQESDIESYFVWIPKNSYRLFDVQSGNYPSETGIISKNNLAIQIKFGLINTNDSVKDECTTPMNKNKTQGLSGESWNCEMGNYITPSAFLAFGGNGFWVGKFETSQNNNGGIQIKPNVTSWRNIAIGDAFKNSQNYMSKLQSHLMKNTEWGAVAYLTQSIYGRCDKNKTCSEVTINGYSNYKTGYTNTTAYGEQDNEQLASTTGNYSGIYDMSGGAWELMASVIVGTDGKTPVWGSSGLDLSTLNDSKYYDVYKNYGTSIGNWNSRILGDAIGEVGPFAVYGNSGTHCGGGCLIGSMYGDYAWWLTSGLPFGFRGGRADDASFNNGSYSGIFAFSHSDGGGGVDKGFRITLG